MRKILFNFFHGIFFIICVDLIGMGLWSWAVVRTYDNVVPKVQMAAVLISDFDKETGDLGPETLRRLDRVLELYRDETVSYILCVGGARPRDKVFGSQLMRRFLLDEGIPAGRVFLEKKSFDTSSNWHMAYKTVKGYGWDRLIVVSSPFHLHRVRQIIRDEPEKRLKVFFSPYSLKDAQPSITYFGIWRQVHYEWLAHFSQLLPRKTYKKLIHHMRGQ